MIKKYNRQGIEKNIAKRLRHYIKVVEKGPQDGFFLCNKKNNKAEERHDIQRKAMESGENKCCAFNHVRKGVIIDRNERDERR